METSKDLTSEDLTSEEIVSRIERLENKIIAMCLVAGQDKKKRDQLIDPLCAEILELSKNQKERGSDGYKR